MAFLIKKLQIVVLLHIFLALPVMHSTSTGENWKSADDQDEQGCINCSKTYGKSRSTQSSLSWQDQFESPKKSKTEILDTDVAARAYFS